MPRALVIGMIAIGLVACGKQDKKEAATQVAAKVGSEEISVHQINQVLQSANTNGATPEAVQKMSREVLEKLIDQQLAIDQSNEKKLSRSPEVVAQIEAAKRDILARAYIQQLVAGLPKPSQDELKLYYAEHPQLFAERRVFELQELIIPAQTGLTEQLGTLVNAGKSMEEVANWLKSRDIKFSGGGATRAAEQIPMELLTRLQRLKDGQTLFAQTAQSVTLVHIVNSKLVPVDEASALPRIAQFLGNQRASEAIATNMKALRKSAKIEYVGEFAKPLETATAPSPAASAPALNAEDQKRVDLEKGVAGLK